MSIDLPQPTGHGPHPQVLSSCPLCQSSYTPIGARILAERDDAHLLFLECRQCGTAVTALVTAGPQGLTSVGALTDLTSVEVLDFADRQSVTHDDVLDLFDWLDRQPATIATLRSQS